MENHKPSIGYASMNEDVTPNTYKTLRKDNIDEDNLFQIIKHNLTVLEKTIDYNIKNHNKMFRVSSSLIPFGSSPLNILDWGEVFKEEFVRMREKIEINHIRISAHPGQYTVLNSPNKEVVIRAIADLKYHVKLIKLLSPCKNSKIILHIGGVYGNKEEAMNRFIDVYVNQLSEEIKSHLVIENDDRLYTVEDVLWISSQTKIPVVFDNLHHAINASLQNKSMENIVNDVVATWREEKPKFHYSQQAIGKRAGAHSDTINLEKFIKDYQEIYAFVDVDIMLEVKDKNRSFIKVNQYFNSSQTILEQEWARYKYYAMSKSQKAYNELRLIFRNNNATDPILFYKWIDDIQYLEPNIKSEINAFSHVWGYFKKFATIKEKEAYLKFIENQDIKAMVRHLKKLSNKYEIKQLQNSYYFKER